MSDPGAIFYFYDVMAFDVYDNKKELFLFSKKKKNPVFYGEILQMLYGLDDYFIQFYLVLLLLKALVSGFHYGLQSFQNNCLAPNAILVWLEFTKCCSS